MRGMLGTLDPHSSFFDPREYAQMRERQEGRYYGIGISIQAIDGDITAMSVFEGLAGVQEGHPPRRRPRERRRRGRQGLDRRAGDAASCAGRRARTVDVGVKRRGYEELIPFELTRDEVYIPTVPAVLHDRRDHRLHPACRTSARTPTATSSTRCTISPSKGHARLLFDIRSNPGGPLDQAIKVVERVPAARQDDRLHARPHRRIPIRTTARTEDGEFTDMPIVVLANRNSASASEIVTGALQDHDRAYIVGETTFGKALVQSVYRISGSAGLALTTAHYYTPSGRLIQRPWDASFDEYLSYSLRDQDANKPHNPSDLKHTDAGRPVYSGGGIEPDKRVAGPLEGFNPGRFGRMLYARGEFANYAQKYAAEGDTRITQTVDRPQDRQAATSSSTTRWSPTSASS